jgi:uncharacterized protein DUF3574
MIARAKSLCLDAMGGYTLSQADGGWKDEHDKIWEEPSVVFTLVAQPHELSILDLLVPALRDTFQQRCVLVMREPVELEFI